MIAYPPNDVPGQAPAPANGILEPGQALLEKAAKDLRAAIETEDRGAAEAAASTLSAGIKRSINGDVRTDRMARTAAETDVTGKARSGVPVRIRVFNGRRGREPGHADLVYRTSASTATDMAKQFLSPGYGGNSAVGVIMEDIQGVMMPKCTGVGPKPWNPLLGKYDTPVSIDQDSMLCGQDPNAPSNKIWSDVYGGRGPIRLGVPCMAQPFLSADVAARDASLALQLDTVIGNSNTSVSQWLGSNGFPAGSPTEPDVTERMIDATRMKARLSVYGVLDKLDQDKDKFAALGVRTASSYSNGLECRAVYLDVTAGKAKEALAELSKICGPGEDLGHVKNFGMQPSGFRYDMAVTGRDSDGKMHAVVPVMFTSNADIEAYPMQINYAQLAAEDRGWASLAYSEPVVAMSRKAGDGLIKPIDIDGLRKAAENDRKVAVAEAFGLEHAALESVSADILDRRNGLEPGPTDKMIRMKSAKLREQLIGAREALQKGEITAEPGTAWTDVKTSGLKQGPSFRF